MLAVVAPLTTSVVDAHAETPQNAHEIKYDQYSFLVDGTRVNLWSGEFHYFRLPSPDLWRDILEKIKAGGFNAVSLYFDWAYHSPKQGTYDFTGVRDVERLLKLTDELGIYVIARPGPYINAEVDSGGFPGWLTTQNGKARSNDPEFLKAADEWLSQIDPIIARHQLTTGKGTVMSYQVENELWIDDAAHREYMEHLKAKAKADGITVPLVGNHIGRGINYNSGVGALDVDMVDSYPQDFDCSNPKSGRTPGATPRPAGKPLGIAEFQGGSFDPWGGPGYDKCRQLTGADFNRVFYKDAIGQGVTEQSFYMLYGGTSWGWQPDPYFVYTSYDYGGAITEPRQLTAKYDENKRIGYFTQAVAPLAKTEPLPGAPLTSSALTDRARVNPDDGTQFHVLRHRDVKGSNTDSTHLSLNLDPSYSYTYDDVNPTIKYTGAWTHASNETWTAADFKQTESFTKTAGDSVSVPFTGTAIRWISSYDSNHGIADVYLDGVKVKTVDGYGRRKKPRRSSTPPPA